MGKYIVRVTKKQTKEVVVDACNAEEAKKRGIKEISASEKTSK